MLYYRKITFIVFCIAVLIVKTPVFAVILPGSVKGKVLDASTHSPIPGANIVVHGTDMGSGSDLNGEYTIIGLKPGTYHVTASALGFSNFSKGEISVSAGRSIKIDFMLEPTVIKGPEVNVKCGYFKQSPTLATSTHSLSYEEIRRAPGSAEDVQRSIQALPGVLSRNDQTNEIIVRGGSPSENLTIIDGLEIDNINHFPDQSSSGGPISAVNTEFLEDVTFSTGGFSAKYGDRLSSILDLKLRDGNHDEFSGQLETSMAGAGFNLEGGIPHTNGSYLFSYRKSYLDLLKGPIGLTAVPHFWDSQLKISSSLTPTTNISILGLYGKDRISIEADEEDAWSRGAESVNANGHTAVFGARLRKVLKRGYAELVMGRSEISYSYDVYEVDKDPLGNSVKRLFHWDRSTESSDQLHLNWTGKTRNVDQLFAGISLKPVTFSHNLWLEPDTTILDLNNDGIADGVAIQEEWRLNENATSLKYAGYLQYRWRPVQSVSVLGGLRVDGFEFSDKITFAPRLSMKWAVNPDISCNIAFGTYYQALSLMDYLSHQENRKLPHKRSDHLVGGLTYLLRQSTQLTLEGYYKVYRDLPVSQEWMNFYVDPSLRTFRLLSVGEKETWGFELFAQQKLSRNWYGTFAYSFGKALSTDPVFKKIDTENVLTEMSFPSSYDFRHVSTVVVGYNFSGLPVREFQKHWYGWWTIPFPVNGDELTISSRFRYVSGRPYTPNYWTDTGQELGYAWKTSDDINSARYPAYSRWDIRWDSKWYTGGQSLILFLEVQNVLDRGNIAQYIYPNLPDNEEIPDVNSKDTVYQFRFFFIGGIRYEW